MKRNPIYWALILVISFLGKLSCEHSQNIPKYEDQNYIRDGDMNILIQPIGTCELKDPLGRRIIHYLNKKRILWKYLILLTPNLLTLKAIL
jgi:hypothetical protein